ncbi:MAG TPA: NUDIX domain-containing protein, partial [Bryobacteraceae bacterium]|nr:NUDIX domain-containing protein [Bryobacteraceae bacterium]
GPMNAIEIVRAFDPGPDGAAAKSRDLVLDLLHHSPSPFSRYQYEPGHITCTALVRHPSNSSVLVMHHHRLHRWLLPGGHVEPDDPSLPAVAAREALEETFVRIDPAVFPFLAGIDVHGIPPKKKEPFHLHHDLIWCFRALTDEIAISDEAPQVFWAEESDWERLAIAASIRQSILRSRAQS